MISPYVRRLRLAEEIRSMRSAAGLTHAALAKKIGQSRSQISRLENAHAVDVNDVMGILDVLAVEGEQWTKTVNIAREAAERGWWESVKGIGVRQAIYADLEAGANTIREYQQTFFPGLLHADEYVEARIDADATLVGSKTSTAGGVIDGRSGRQRMLRRPEGPTYEVIVDELTIRRLSAPPEVVQKQLYHLATAVNGDPRLGLRVLPVDARIGGYTVPRCSFSLYTYPDPGDPAVVAIDTVTSDVLLTAPDEVKTYDELYGRLVEAALPQDASLDLLTKAAADLPHE